MIESPELASEMACPIVLQALVDDLQSLLSLPLAPFTYHVVLAIATEVRVRRSAIISFLNLMMYLRVEIELEADELKRS
jgi:hypothetical protein